MKFIFKIRIVIFLLFIIFSFSDFVSFLPSFIQNIKFAENLKIQQARAVALEYVGGAEASGNSAAYNVSLTALAGGSGSAPVEGDLVIVSTGFVSTTNGNPGVSTAGYTEVADLYGNDSRDANLSVNWKIMGPIPDSAVTCLGSGSATNGSVCAVHVWRNIDPVSPMDVAITIATGNNSSIPNGPAITPVTAGAIVVTTGLGTSLSADASITAPVGYSNQADISVDPGNAVIIGIASEAWISGIEDPAVWTNWTTSTSDAWAAVTLAIRPAPSGPDAANYSNNTEGALADGGRSGQEIIVTGTNFGAGPSDGAGNAVKIGMYIVSDGNVSIWTNTEIRFTIPVAAPYGGIGADGLIIRAGGIDDPTPLDFYVYPNITSAPASGQIGDLIAISGDHFGAAAGAITINIKTATVGTWGETSLSNVKIPGQEGALNITGKIELTRADGKTSNQYPAGNFTILAPSVSGPNAEAVTGQTNVTITFSGNGIDTDAGSPTVIPILKLTKGELANCAPSPTCIVGNPASYAIGTNYLQVSESFDLTGAATGYWKLVIVNMDGQSGSFGDEVSTGFNIIAPAPIVTSITPSYGLNFNIVSNVSIGGSNFQSGATVKLTKIGQSDISPSILFNYSDPYNLNGGAFDFTLGKTIGLWKVVVIQGSQSGSFGDEINDGFEIRSSLPSNPSSLIQSKTQGGASVGVGEGIGGQTTVYFGMDMSGGLVGRYYPQIEVKPIGTAFECINSSPAICIINNGGFFIENSTDVFSYDGITPVQGWVSITGVDGAEYHWQARVRNSSGMSNWVSFGGGNPEGEVDVYIDNTAPTITPYGGSCASAYTNVTDLGAIISWNTVDVTSGAQTPPGSGTWATAQVDYKKTTDGSWSSSSINPRLDGLHQINLSGLAPNTAYLFKMKSKDAVNNEAIYEDAVNCTFTTTSTRPIKTVEFFIGQEMAQNTGTRISMPFSVYIPESPGATVSVKSAFIEIAGISSASSSKDINVELRRDSGFFAEPGTNYNIDSTGTTTPFTILFDALAPITGDGNENMADITAGASQYNYTLYLNGGTALEPISIFSAKLIITYSYAL